MVLMEGLNGTHSIVVTHPGHGLWQVHTHCCLPHIIASLPQMAGRHMESVLGKPQKNCYFFSGPATKTGVGGVMARPLRIFFF